MQFESQSWLIKLVKLSLVAAVQWNKQKLCLKVEKYDSSKYVAL